MNKPVKFETAQLLQKKGFKGQTHIDEDYTPIWYHKDGGTLHEGSYFGSFDNMITAPTIAEVIMWLHEKYDVWISANRVTTGTDEWEYQYVIQYLPKEFENAKRRSIHLEKIESFKEGIGSYAGAWETPTEAYEAAIKYTLEQLI